MTDDRCIMICYEGDIFEIPPDATEESWAEVMAMVEERGGRGVIETVELGPGWEPWTHAVHIEIDQEDTGTGPWMAWYFRALGEEG